MLHRASIIEGTGASAITIRPFEKRDIDFVISGQLKLYEVEYGLTSEIWRRYLTDGVDTFVQNFDEKKDCMYILEWNCIPSGCVAITHINEETAQLRFFYMEEHCRGLGLGRNLIDRAVDFCKEKKYRHVFLWTFSTLYAARHLYRAKGFKLTDGHENNDWGEPVLQERWDLEL
jgi:GNAT superfamily N-acetyltransferase